MKETVLICCYFLVCLRTHAQMPDSFRLAVRLPIQANFATADQLGNYYTIGPDAAVKKYAPDGTLITRYSNNQLGAPSLLDVSNPLKIMVWYPGFGTIILLDRNLTELGILSLNTAGYPEIRTAAVSSDGNLWIYDEAAFKLRKITTDGQQLFESQALNMELPQAPALVCIRDDGDRVCAGDSLHGLLLFNVYGQFERLYPLKQVRDVQLAGDTMLALQPSALLRINLRAFYEQAIPLPAIARAPGNRIWLSGKKLFVQEGSNLVVFELH